MDRKIDIVFNSEIEGGKKQFQIASGHISETTILFEKENIVAVVNAKGSVEFFDVTDKLLASGEILADESGREVYEEICCQVDGDKIVIDFPIYEWVDHYPNCDGDHDRWSTKIIGYNSLKFDVKKNIVQ